MSAERWQIRCNDCGHVGNRTFTEASDGKLRDVLAGDRGVTPEHTICQCSSRDYALVPAGHGDTDSDAWVYEADVVEQLALAGEFDARKWAATFVATVRQTPEVATDVDTMVAWFASAIMAGYDHARTQERAA
jgi:hypothetical protein